MPSTRTMKLTPPSPPIVIMATPPLPVGGSGVKRALKVSGTQITYLEKWVKYINKWPQGMVEINILSTKEVEMNIQGSHSYKFSKFPDFSLTQLYFSLTG